MALDISKCVRFSASLLNRSVFCSYDFGIYWFIADLSILQLHSLCV